MSRLINILSLLLLTSLTASAQWTLRPSFGDVKAWHRYGGGVFCRCAHGAFTIDGDGEINTLTRTAGLSSASLTASCADEAGGFWALGYSDGSVDVCGRRITHIESPSLSPGAVRDMDCDGSVIVAATGDGVMLVDVAKMEMSAFCFFGEPVERIALNANEVCTAKRGEFFKIDIHSYNFQDFGAWRKVDSFDFYDAPAYDGATPASMPEDSFSALAAANDKAIAANRFCTQISRQGLENFRHPGGGSYTAIFFNPYNPSHYFLGDSDGILYEYVGNVFKANYNYCNGAPIVSMDCNQAGDLFILSASENKPVSIFDHNGNWHAATSFNSMKSSTPKQLLFVNDNIVLVNMGKQGIFAVDLGDTPLDFSDDKTAVCQVVSGGARVGTEINAMRLSQSGYLYVATDKGVAYTLTPEQLVDGGVGFIRPIVTETSDRDGVYSQYLLSSKTITSIAEDAAGRKWFGTRGAGVFVVNDDCNEQILHFNTRNSPLPSDTIQAIEIVQNTGEVFFHTSNGLASYVSDAQKSADDLDNIIIYPNPVRPDYDGDIHISGLESGCDVRITDVAGHLVHKATAESGLISWDGHNLNGRKCATGVYLVFVYNVETKDKKVKKMLIVR
ncbi:MAG: hypothetical protein J6T60_05150 [Bacteroidales bacterium]|nr:hypothetical protein [Bacteroidales bacterium]